MSRPLRKASEKSKILDEKKSFVVLSMHETPLESIWQFLYDLGMKIKRFQTNFLKIDLLVAEINRSTFSIMPEKVVPKLVLQEEIVFRRYYYRYT